VPVDATQWDAKKDQILDTAANLIMESGFDAMTVRDLARAVGVAQSTLYYYVGSKQQLLHVVVTSFVDDMIGRLEAVVESHNDPARMLRDFIFVMLDLAAHRRARMNAWLRERRALPSAAWPEIHAKRDHIDYLLQTVLVSGEQQGIWRPFPLPTARLAIFGIVSWALEWLDLEGPKSVEQLAGEFADLVLHGLTKAESVSPDGTVIGDDASRRGVYSQIPVPRAS